MAELLSNEQADTEAGARVAENVLACVAHMCVHNNNALRNSKRAIVALNLTGNTRLQHTYPHLSSPILTYAHVCRRMLTYADAHRQRAGAGHVQPTRKLPAHLASRAPLPSISACRQRPGSFFFFTVAALPPLLSAHVCSRMLTYGDVW